MKILIDIGHPAHVHLFKHFAWIMQKKGHLVLFTSREKEVAVHLLKAYEFDPVVLGKSFRNILGKMWGMIKFDFLLAKVVLRFKADILLSAGSIYAAQVSWFFNKPHIAFEDTGNMEQIRLYRPFTKVILVSTDFHKELGYKQIRYNGYHELAYLHRDYFHPDKNICSALKCNKSDRYIILRFVSWDASHDVGESGLNIETKVEVVNRLSKFAEIFITSEVDLPSQLKKYQIKIPPEKMHDALAFAELVITEGATIASECAMLGTPAIYVNSITAGTLEGQEKSGLIYSFRDSNGVVDKAVELLNTPNLKDKHRANRQKMLEDKIDVTKFMCWFVEQYPESVDTMKSGSQSFRQFN